MNARAIFSTRRRGVDFARENEYVMGTSCGFMDTTG